MNPNLKAQHATSMRFSTTLVLMDELVSRICSIAPPDDDGDSIFYDMYDGHLAWAWVDKGRRSDKDQRKYGVQFFYRVGRGRRLRKTIPRIDQLLATLSPIREKAGFHCTVSFEFRKAVGAKPVIKLPIRYSDSPAVPFDMIQGLHLAKLDGKNRQYEVFLEAGAGETLLVGIEFDYTSKFVESLPTQVLEHAAALTASFVWREP